MPRKDEMQELIDYCGLQQTKVDEVEGFIVLGPKGNCIFFPAAGYRYGSSLSNEGGIGTCWSSTPNDSSDDYRAYGLYFGSDGVDVYSNYRSYGQSVRPVSK